MRSVITEGAIVWPFELLLWIDPLLFEEDEAVEDRLEWIELLRDGIDGRSCMFFWKSLNTFSKPGCICRAIMGKLLRSSLKDLMSFLDSKADCGPDRPLEDSSAVASAGCVPFNKVGRIAGFILIDSYEPRRGFEM